MGYEKQEHKGRYEHVLNARCVHTTAHDARRTHLDEARMRPPAVNHAPLNALPKPARPPLPKQLIQAAPRRAAAILRVLRERHGPPHTIRAHLTRRLLRERACVPERDIRLVRRGGRVQLVEQRGHALALELRVAQDGRAAADRGVLRLDLGRAAPRDEGRDEGLEGEGDEVAV